MCICREGVQGDPWSGYGMLEAVSLLERFLARDERALARAITYVEAGVPAGRDLLKSVRKHGAETRIIGITGAPGSGKSTLTDGLIGMFREQAKPVAVVAVDPTSPYSGGAILGDRIRMGRWHQDPEVYIRSMATRGHLGGLAAATLQVVSLLAAYGFEEIVIETVGVGQSEIDIVEVADTTVLVLTPGQGDGVQAFKAGIMEIADIFVVNKFDHPGGGRLKREIQATLDLGTWPEGRWRPPILETIASKAEGIDQLEKSLNGHYSYLEQGGGLKEARRRRARFEVAAILSEQLKRYLESREEELVQAVLSGSLSPEEAVERALRTESATLGEP